MKVKLKNGLVGKSVKDVHIIFDNHDKEYSHTVPVEDIKTEINDLKEKLNKLLDDNTFTVNTRDYGNIDVIDADSIYDLLNEYKED